MTQTDGSLDCPSAQPDMREPRVLGVLGGTPAEPRVAYLNARVEVTDELLNSTGNVPPTRVLRFAARCESSKCTHFDGTDCKLARRIVEGLPEVVDSLPPCTIRPNCRWHQQEGAAACRRCPQVITFADLSDRDMRAVAREPSA